MNLKIIAQNDTDIFLGYSVEHSYVLLCLMEPDPIELNDVLVSDHWDDSEEVEKYVFNSTQDEKVYLTIENWGCTREIGYLLLSTLGHPSKLTTIESSAPAIKGFVPHSNYVFKKVST